jgi:hypothetical protein
MKKLFLFLVLIFAIQFYSLGQSTTCEPEHLYPNQFDCGNMVLCSLNVDLGNCGSVMVYFNYRLCEDLISGGWVCTFQILAIPEIPPDCYYEFLGIEYEMFDIIMNSILEEAYYHAGCGDDCRPGSGCGYYNDFYLASCWHWIGDITPNPNSYTLEPCSNEGCCRIHWQICIVEGEPQFIKLSELPEIPCRPDPENGCYVIICGED